MTKSKRLKRPNKKDLFFYKCFFSYKKKTAKTPETTPTLTPQRVKKEESKGKSQEEKIKDKKTGVGFEPTAYGL